MKPTANVWPVDPIFPAVAAIARAVQVIRTGGLVVFPTRGLYGLGGDPFDSSAVERIFNLKGRATSKALLVLIADNHDLGRLAKIPNAMALDLMNRFWPGRVTFVLPARKGMPAMLTGDSGKIGVRRVAHPVAVALVRALAAPLIGTSANISGAGGCGTVGQIDPELIRNVDLVLDAGPLAGGPGSTVVDVCGQTPLVVREGAVAAEEIMAAFKSRNRCT